MVKQLTILLPAVVSLHRLNMILLVRRHGGITNTRMNLTNVLKEPPDVSIIPKTKEEVFLSCSPLILSCLLVKSGTWVLFCKKVLRVPENYKVCVQSW